MRKRPSKDAAIAKRLGLTLSDLAEIRRLIRKRTRPRWVAKSHELRLGRFVVKGFHQPAPLQILILVSFQEQNWRHLIADPLPGGLTERAQKARLHDAIKDLNRHQSNPFIRFHGNGDGTGVIWEYVVP